MRSLGSDEYYDSIRFVVGSTYKALGKSGSDGVIVKNTSDSPSKSG